MGSRGATPGKRVVGLRVVARDGARLTGAAVIARNAMREIEVFLPLSFLGQQTAAGHRRHVPRAVRADLERDFPVLPVVQPRPAAGRGPGRRHLGGSNRESPSWAEDLVGSALRSRRTFPEAALKLYGIYELQTLEEVLRNKQPDAIMTVAKAIRDKAGLPDEGDDFGFLSDYYAALCARLEAGLMVGRRRENKFDQLALSPFKAAILMQHCAAIVCPKRGQPD